MTVVHVEAERFPERGDGGVRMECWVGIPTRLLQEWDWGEPTWVHIDHPVHE